MTRADEWSRVDYRSRAAAAICAIATTLVAAVTLTAYVGTRIGFAEGALLPTPPREAAFVAPQCPPRYVHQIFGLNGDDEMPAPWSRAQERPRRAGGLVVRLDRGRVLLRPTAAAATTAPVG